jgi:hypothetical protein
MAIVAQKSPVKRQVPITSYNICGKLLKYLWKTCGMGEENFR